MLSLDPHTHLINLWIALAEGDPILTDNLASEGYTCQVVEDEYFIYDSDGSNIINPDLILATPTHNHVLIVECKSEEVDEDQLRRYAKVGENEDALISQAVVEGIAATEVSAEAVVSSFSDISGPDIPPSVAIVHFDYNPTSSLAIWNLDSGEFSEPNTRSRFPINTHPSTPLPTGYYPFDIYEADKEEMVTRIFTTVVGKAITEETVNLRDVLNTIHPYWDKLGNTKKSELEKRAKKIFLELLDAGLDEYLEKVAGTNGREWKRISKSIQALSDRTDYYVDEVMDNLPQSRLDSDAWSAGSVELVWEPGGSDEIESDDDD